jgi:hypothetical protein
MKNAGRVQLSPLQFPLLTVPALTQSHQKSIFHRCKSTSIPSMSEASASNSSFPLADAISCTPASQLQPRAFLVSWFGVLALSFRGWPAPLVKLKSELNKHAAGSWCMKAERAGSMWPKITLGCLKDGRQLTLTELRELHALTLSFQAFIAASSWMLNVCVRAVYCSKTALWRISCCALGAEVECGQIGLCGL